MERGATLSSSCSPPSLQAFFDFSSHLLFLSPPFISQSASFFCSSLPIASSPQGISVWYRVVVESFLKSASSLRSASVWICVVCIFSVFVCVAAPRLCSSCVCLCMRVVCVRGGCKADIGTVLSLILSVPPRRLGSRKLYSCTTITSVYSVEHAERLARWNNKMFKKSFCIM